jgi:hypothetical protein
MQLKWRPGFRAGEIIADTLLNERLTIHAQADGFQLSVMLASGRTIFSLGKAESPDTALKMAEKYAENAFSELGPEKKTLCEQAIRLFDAAGLEVKR